MASLDDKKNFETDQKTFTLSTQLCNVHSIRLFPKCSSSDCSGPTCGHRTAGNVCDAAETHAANVCDGKATSTISTAALKQVFKCQ